MLRDLRFALHLIAKDRWYSAVAVVALSLGIGVNATVFTLVNAVLIRGLPYKDSAQLYMLGSQRQDGNRGNASPADLADWQGQSASFAGFGAFRNNSVNVSDDRSAPQSAFSADMSAGAFALLGERPLLGREFTAADERSGAENVAIIGFAMWKSRYGEDREIVGRTLRLDGKPATIIGVMPEGMQFPSNAELWTPMAAPAAPPRRDARSLAVFARLRTGVSRTQAQTEMNGIAQRLAAAYPDTNKDFTGVRIETFNERFNGGPIRVVMLAMLGAVGFVLLIACANVANLQLSRSVSRTREVAIRIALGASRWRVVRQLLVESVVLGIMGGLIGLGLATVGVRLFDNAVSGTGKPYWIQFTMDFTVFGYLAAICVLTGILFGLAPALQVTKTNVNEVLKEGGRGNAGNARARWLTGTMVVLELALTLVLLVGAGLMIRSFLKLYSLDSGIRADHLVTMNIQLPEVKYATPETRRLFFDRLLPKLAALPGADSAALTTSIPPFGAGRRTIEIEGQPAPKIEDQSRQAGIVTISESFFDTVGASLRRGRAFQATDGLPGVETVVVNEKFASVFFPGEDPIGRRLRLMQAAPPPGAPAPAPQPWRTIVGISPSIRHASPQDAEPPAIVYAPYRQEGRQGLSVLVRTHVPPATVMAAIRNEVQSLDPDQPVFGLRTYDDLLSQQMWPYRVFGSLFAIFAVIALVMSAVGLYAVMAYSVTQRTAEIGVRMALGAESRQVSWLVLRRGLIQMGLGLGLGLTGAFFLSKVMRSLLVQVAPSDPVTFVSITVILSLVAVAACLFPARRATRVDPLIALRAD